MGRTCGTNAGQPTAKIAALWRTIQGETLSWRTEKAIYKDSLKVSVKSFGICDNTWESLAKNRSAWRAGITNGARDAEDRRLNEAEMKRTARKARADSTSTIGSEHTCSTCGKDCRARIGLISHLRTHRPVSTTD